MKKKDILNKFDFIKKHPLFSHLDSQYIDEVVAESSIETFKPGDIIISERLSPSPEFYILIEGELEAFKEDNKKNILNIIQPNDIFGEGIIFDQHKRHSSVRARTEAVIIVIPSKTIEALAREVSAFPVTTIYKKLHHQTIKYLLNINNKALALIKTQKNISIFLINIVTFLSLFAALIPSFISFIKSNNPTWVTTPLVLFGSILLISRLIYLKIPLSFIGITRKNLKKSIYEGIFFSVGILVAIILLKLVAIHYIERFSQSSLFFPAYEQFRVHKGFQISMPMFYFTQLVYATNAIFQEILVRGSIQGMFKQVISHYPRLLSIILASLVFACAHAYFGTVAMLEVFFPGLFWGWLYERNQNIISPIISHIIIGVGVLGLIGPL